MYYTFKCRSEGELVEKALAINKPVVNIQWLNDILFGEKLGIKEPGNSKYQKFDLFNPFSVNYDMVSHLMGMVSINYIILYLVNCFPINL